MSGPPIPYRRVRVGSRERERWVEELLAQPAAGATMSGTGGNDRPSRSEVSNRLREFDPDRFPDRVPPFHYGYTPASPRGHVWIRLDVESGPRRTVFDVIGRDGGLVQRLAIDGRARVVGFGPDSVYLVRMDGFDLEWLERYRYPTD